MYEELKEIYRNHDLVRVFLAQEITSKEKVVIKVTNLDHVTPDHVQSAKREIELHSKLEHTNIVKLQNWVETETRLALFLEQVEDDGYFTQRLVENNEPYNMERDGAIDELSVLLYELLDALQYIHG
jgi:serine/threonine protein kinase